MSWWGELADWFGKNKDWIVPVAKGVAGAATSAYQADNRQGARDAYIEELRRQEQEKWEQGKANYDAYLAYLMAGATGGGGGGGGGGGAGDAARLAANAAAQRRLKQGYRQAMAQLQPYAAAGRSVIGPMAATYNTGLQGVADLYGKMVTPQALSTMAIPQKPATNIDLGIGAYFK